MERSGINSSRRLRTTRFTRNQYIQLFRKMSFPHTLRHTCESWLVMAGRPLIEVRDLLGHSTVKMTERYAHLAPENLVDAVSSLENRLHYGSTPDDSNKVTGDESHQVLNFTEVKWWARKDSNLRPMDYESTALTN